MVSDTLKPNVQDLQKDVIELLGQINALMGRASTALGSDSAGKKYGELQQEINNATSNVKDLALRMAIVAPMKAGKSTIINAIVGQDILPSRNAAMTTLPTEIVFDTELSEPILILSPQILAVFQETLLTLKRKIDTLEDRGHSKIAQYPHLAQLLEKIQAMEWFQSLPKL
jgi:ribosome biogenesis GTPase A